MTRDIERGTRAVQSLISYSLYSILPTLIEVTLVLTASWPVKFDAWFAASPASRWSSTSPSPSR
jgi:ATP-binding cassette, subfamily B, heavy metal transporter